jgi:hypothetical protein
MLCLYPNATTLCMFFKYVSQCQTLKSQHSNWTQLPSVGPPDSPLPFTYFLQSWKHYFSIWLKRTTSGHVLENFRTAFSLSTSVRVVNATFLNITLSILFVLHQSLFFNLHNNYYDPRQQGIVFGYDSRSAVKVPSTFYGSWLFCEHNSLPLAAVLSQMKPIYIPTPRFSLPSWCLITLVAVHFSFPSLCSNALSEYTCARYWRRYITYYI